MEPLVKQTKIEGALQKKIETFFIRGAKEQPKLCPIKDVLHQISDKWAILCLMQLGYNRTLRFNELKANVPEISQKMLTVTLRTLEANGLVTRKIYPQIPPKVEYTITHRGEGFLEKVMDMVGWAWDNLDEICAERVEGKPEEIAQLTC